MIVLIRKKGVAIPPEVSNMSNVMDAELTELLIPDFSDNEYIRTAQYIELLNNIMKCYNTDNQYNILITKGIPDEILGFIIGYNLLSWGVTDIIDREDLRLHYQILTNENNITQVDVEIQNSEHLETYHLIWKILKLCGCEFKKYNQYVNEIRINDNILDINHYIINGLVALYGRKPPFYNDNTPFINTLIKMKGQWR